MSKAAEYQAKLRAERVVAGLCVFCGKLPPEEGKRKCAPCRERAAQATKAWSERNPDKVRERRRRAYRAIKSDPERNAQLVVAQRARNKAYDARNPRRKWERSLLVNFNLTPEQYDSMLEEQGGVCAICGAKPAEGQTLDVDHCHSGGHVRGLLCRSCNLGLGKFGDNIDTLRAAVAYLLADGEVW